MAGRTVVLTGPTSGIGRETAIELGRRGATLVLVGRSPERLAAVQREVEATGGAGGVATVVADLSEFGPLRRAAEEVLRRAPHLDVLINNAGAVFARRELTSDGHEWTWALNVLAPFLLTHLLVDRLRASAPSRVLNVSSAAHRGAHLDFDDLEAARQYAGFRVYGRSKLALLLLTRQFARRLAGSGVTVNALHPGFVATRFGQNNPGAFGGGLRLAEFLFAIRPKRGARTPVYLASSPEVASVTGEYFVRSRVASPSADARDDAAGLRLWEVCAAQTGVPRDALPLPAGGPPPAAAPTPGRSPSPG